MEIKIKTYDETSERWVKVEVPEGERFDIHLEGPYQITNRGWVDAEASDLSKALTLTTTSRDFNRNKAVGLENDLAQARQEIQRLEAENAAEVDRLRRELAQVDRLRREMAQSDVRMLESGQDLIEAQAKVRNLEGELAKARSDAARFKGQAYDENERAGREKQRADENRAWAERTESKLTRAIKDIEAQRERADDEEARANKLAERFNGEVKESMEARDRMLLNATTQLRKIQDVIGDDATVNLTRDTIVGRLLDVRDLARETLATPAPLDKPIWKKHREMLIQVQDIVAEEKISNALKYQAVQPYAQTMKDALKKIREVIAPGLSDPA